MELISCETQHVLVISLSPRALDILVRLRLGDFIVELKCKQSSSFNIYWQTVSLEMAQENNKMWKI